MALLVGRYINKIDKKGRVSIPKPFREALGASTSSQLYAYPLFKVPAIEACDEAFMARLSRSLDDLDMFSDEQDDLAAVILENAHPLTLDPEGRVVLPDVLREYASIDGQATFVGRGARFQVWAPEAYESRSKKALEQVRARRATLRLREIPDEGGGQ